VPNNDDDDDVLYNCGLTIVVLKEHLIDLIDLLGQVSGGGRQETAG